VYPAHDDRWWPSVDAIEMRAGRGGLYTLFARSAGRRNGMECSDRNGMWLGVSDVALRLRDVAPRLSE
jgi:hypothetical protein